MRYQIFIISLLAVGILGMATPAPADYEVDGYNLQRVEIQGYVESVQDQAAYIRTDDGAEVGIQLGPQSYWEDRGYYLPVGEYVRIEAWYDPYGYTDWYFAGEIWGDGFHFVLTNGYGVPYWVMARDDYYYSLGYRASCVSYMVWYDCPPAFFVYVILPPPPPYYTCYYGPRWRDHHDEWHHHGPGYDRGDYYGDAGQPRPPRRDDPGVPVTPPRITPRNQQPRTEPMPKWQQPPVAPRPSPPLWRDRPVKPQYRQDQKAQYRAPAEKTPGRWQPRNAEPRQRANPSPGIQPKPRPRDVKYQDRPDPPQVRAPRNVKYQDRPDPPQVRAPRDVKYQERPAKPQVREPRAPSGNAPRQYSPPSRSSESRGNSGAQRSSGNRGQERRSNRR